MALTLDEEKKLPALHPVTRQTLDLFVQKVSEQEGTNLKKIVLFGSVAREEANKDSDIDVLVVLKEKTWDDFKLVSNAGYDVWQDVDFDENAYLQPVTVSEGETQGLTYWGLMQNISREGVILYDSGN